MRPDPEYLCPLCRTPLHLQGKTYKCSNNHSFDEAKEGYVNLLPVQFKHSKDPGDNKQMVTARRGFLEQGYYLPLRDKLVAIYRQYCPDSNTNVLDIGCGEGYYTCAHKDNYNQVYGIDIAKNAIRIAAKKYQSCHFSVGSVAQLPFADNTVDWGYSIYAPIKVAEFQRVIKQDGYLLTVSPGKRHLWQLKSLIYRTPQEHDETLPEMPGFELVEQHRLAYEMDLLTTADKFNLLSMTPFAFKTSDALRQALENEERFECETDFVIRLFKRQ
ncbi:23S rRNA (guanine(745)-N(1))-methyltransferase [Thalassotalea mangrovi]|uniref:23S rRNA (Guanine(745)-N(1))-methyltransferase n=1 Tax=Thalassotalea mangrovi TaxID=2572245 RepID=A0A4U1B3Y9_9GAMM|nr:23S rRNA (guanine(745)-N(1))-methyltransferase [Thalassotalea mangrovi]TKB44352.1 23S rRNA (guanine(745)-N(1))-methyltransferase [Thalassotalea mangrovi]